MSLQHIKSVHFRWLAILSILMLSFSCVKDPEIVAVSNFEIEERKDSVLLVSLLTQISNPNKMSISLTDFAYQIHLNQNEIGNGIIEKEFTLKSNGLTELENKLQVSIPSLMKSISLILDNDSFPAEVSMQFKVMPLGIKMSKTKTVFFKLEELMKNMSGDFVKESLSVKGMKIKEVTPSHTLLAVKFEFDNKFPLEYTLDSLAFDIFDDESLENQLGETQISKSIKFRAKEITPFEVDMKIKNLTTGLSIFKKIITNERNFFLKGSVFINFEDNLIEVPISQKIEPL